MEPPGRNTLNKETKHAVFIVFPRNMRCRQAAAAHAAALGDCEGRRGSGGFSWRVHIPPMLAVLGYLGLSHISIHFSSVSKFFFPSWVWCEGGVSVQHAAVPLVVSVHGAFKPSYWFLHAWDWWWFCLKCLCRHEERGGFPSLPHASGTASPGAQQALPTSLSSLLLPHPALPAAAPSCCCRAGTLGCAAQLYGPGMTTANPQMGLGHSILPPPTNSTWSAPVTVPPPSLQHPPAKPLWEPVSLQPEPPK